MGASRRQQNFLWRRIGQPQIMRDGLVRQLAAPDVQTRFQVWVIRQRLGGALIGQGNGEGQGGAFAEESLPVARVTNTENVGSIDPLMHSP